MEEGYIFFLAGHETSALVLTWVLAHLGQDLAAQEKLREEVPTPAGSTVAAARGRWEAQQQRQQQEAAAGNGLSANASEAAGKRMVGGATNGMAVAQPWSAKRQAVADERRNSETRTSDEAGSRSRTQTRPRPPTVASFASSLFAIGLRATSLSTQPLRARVRVQ